MEWTSADGSMVYIGQYEDNLKHGEGKFTWTDGRSYEGQWEKGLRHGEGIYTFKTGEQRRGRWVDNVLEEWLDKPTESSSESEDDT
mmetsp:Transcript_30720/g.53417  ORF Transcript_30720/g.53417 Transcript_30720/m.53417 type:complete len:86 (-) Transcript_30720:130-387(-)